MTHLDLFSGIGGFALAVDMVWPGIEHVFCEIDPFCQAILKKHWPNSSIYEDIRTLTNTKSGGWGDGASSDARETPVEINSSSHAASLWQHGTVGLITGGFPCQPFSAAGKRKGTSDDRHLWPEMRRVIQEFRPRYVVAENVRGLLSIEGGVVFETVCTDLEALGYEVQPFLIPACAVGAPHRRDRVWIVAHAAGVRRDGRDDKREGIQRSDEARREARTGNKQAWREDWPTVAARLCRVDDGLPEGVVRPRGWRNAALKAYGNAIVPQVAIQIFNSIKTTF